MPNLLDGYLTEDQLAGETGKTVRTLQAWRQRGIGPPYLNYGKTVYYSREAFLAWLKAQEQGPVRTRRQTRRAATPKAA